MEQIKNLLGLALSTLQAPTETLPVNTDLVRPYFSEFVLVGNETSDEELALRAMVYETERWCVDFLAGTSPRWLSLVGHSGVGKTFLASCVERFLNDHARTVYNVIARPRIDPNLANYETCYSYAQEGSFLVKWSRLLDKARDGDFSLARKSSSDFVKIIDDIGAESLDRTGQATPFAIGTLSKLADERVNKWTFLTSNLSRKEIAERFDVRIASRMMRNSSVVVDCNVRDFNIRREQKDQAA